MFACIVNQTSINIFSTTNPCGSQCNGSILGHRHSAVHLSSQKTGFWQWSGVVSCHIISTSYMFPDFINTFERGTFMYQPFSPSFPLHDANIVNNFFPVLQSFQLNPQVIISLAQCSYSARLRTWRFLQEFRFGVIPTGFCIPFLTKIRIAYIPAPCFSSQRTLKPFTNYKKLLSL